MADLSITATSVVQGANALTEAGLAGAVITAGRVVYRDDTTRKFALADTDGATPDVRLPDGIALNTASPNQPVVIQKGGDIDFGTDILTPGVAYYLSGTPGGICPVADLATGDYPVIVGMAKTARVLTIDIQTTGAVL
ncbi:hypothetical protein [Jiella pelagia]|uniref:Virion structural protein n=1 Tax=Jiella pelagia TaxID=2986949 RepID=A0ABY7BX62_9HYPH|nr:hypothetical protein [Jiella pelagia]WAP67225.1 hypothetical protein OH818_16750 [Jiella pelagia]